MPAQGRRHVEVATRERGDLAKRRYDVAFSFCMAVLQSVFASLVRHPKHAQVRPVWKKEPTDWTTIPVFKYESKEDVRK
jgi:hypothetical protein